MNNGFEKAIHTLEYDKIMALNASYAMTAVAKQRIVDTVPLVDEVMINRCLDETEQALELLTYKGSPGISAPESVIDSAQRACKGAMLTTKELLNVASMLRAVTSLRRYPDGKSTGALEPYFLALTENKGLESDISMKIISEDQIADDASSSLHKIRREIKRAEENVRNILSRLTTGDNAKFLQDTIVTVRQGRYVVPVRAEHKNDVKGLVHDASASGQTLFIEPMAVVEANNKLRELKSEETAEIEKILFDLSAKVADFSDCLKIDFEAVTDLDIIFSRAKFSSDLNGCRPKLSNKKLKLIKARHPLINKDRVVPISVEFGEKENALIITGPNTGGKTVTLKTLGLLSMMAQSGLFVPCDNGTELIIFEQVLADIGDEQSIEQSLSTFSSHMVNIVSILEQCTDRSLVLFDELGAGTDPVEGASLAISILERVRSLGARVAATTHYSELKLYALDTEGVINASCEFDLATLKPTYRLITGIPGRSNAFEISLRLGIDRDIVDRARQLLADDNIRFEEVITRLEETEQSLKKQKSEAEEAREEAKKLREQAEKESKLLKERSESELDRARAQAQRILDAAKAASNAVFNDLNEIKKLEARQLNSQRIDDARNAIKQRINDANVLVKDNLEYQSDAEETYVLPRPVVAGDRVLLADVGLEAIVKSVSGDTVFAVAGRFESKTSISNIRLLDKKVEKQQQKGRAQYTHSAEAVKHEIDVRGNTGDDAWFMIDRYLEDAILAGYETVSVIHGKGTGALRNALWQYFRADKRRIKTFRFGKYGEGDTGVTILELKVK